MHIQLDGKFLKKRKFKLLGFLIKMKKILRIKWLKIIKVKKKLNTMLLVISVMEKNEKIVNFLLKMT